MFNILLYLGLFVACTSACSFNNDNYYDRCGFMMCSSDHECASGDCMFASYPRDGLCFPDGWMIAIFIIFGVLIISCIIGCICCCCCRRSPAAANQEKVVVYQYE